MVARDPLVRTSEMLVFQLVFNDLCMAWTTTLRESLFSLRIFNGFEGSAVADVGNVSFPIGFQWFSHGVHDGLSRIIVFPMDFQWFEGIRWRGCWEC